MVRLEKKCKNLLPISSTFSAAELSRSSHKHMVHTILKKPSRNGLKFCVEENWGKQTFLDCKFMLLILNSHYLIELSESAWFRCKLWIPTLTFTNARRIFFFFNLSIAGAKYVVCRNCVKFMPNRSQSSFFAFFFCSYYRTLNEVQKKFTSFLKTKTFKKRPLHIWHQHPCQKVLLNFTFVCLYWRIR